MQSDYGGEFRPFTKYIIELGISHRLTCPYSSHQNDTVERNHNHIMEMGLTMFSHAFMPLHLWDHSFATIVHLTIRIPSNGLSTF